MRRLVYLFLLFPFLPFLLNAQITKGTYNHQLFFQPKLKFAGANKGLSTAVQYSFAKLFSNHFMLGIDFIADGELSDEEITGDLGFGTALRYYINPESEGYNFFVAAGTFFKDIKFFHALVAEDVLETDFDFNLGFNRLLNSSVALETKLNYAIKDERPYSLSLDVGLRLFLDKEARENSKIATATFSEHIILLGVSKVQLIIGSAFLGMELAPTAAFFLDSRWALGMGMNIQWVNARKESGSNFNFVMRPFVRYYTSEAIHRNYYLQGAVGFGRKLERSKFPSFEQEDQIPFYSIDFRFGSNIFLTPNLALDISYGMEYVYEDMPILIRRPINNKSLYLVGEIGFQFFLDNFIQSED